MRFREGGQEHGAFVARQSFEGKVEGFAKGYHEVGKRRKTTGTVLIVGQTPPPVNGQTVMIQALLEGQYDEIQLYSVRLDFSRSIDEVGLFQTRKIWVLLVTLVKIVIARYMKHAEILYYPPAGPTIVPVLRDIVLLIPTRWMFKHTVFHFHAAGLPEIYPSLPLVLRPFYRMAYRGVDVAIFTTKSTSSAGFKLAAKNIRVVPNGIADRADVHALANRSTMNEVPCILFMGILCEGKGLLTLIEACALLLDAMIPFNVVCAGLCESDEFRKEMEDLIQKRGLANVITFPGLLQGEEKWDAFKNADIFCFPSHYYAESFGIVLIEAMSFGLPIVTTNWRGIPEVVGGSGGAFVVEPKNPTLLAQSLKALLRDSSLRATMGRKNRTWYCCNYTIETYRDRMEEVLREVRNH